MFDSEAPRNNGSVSNKTPGRISQPKPPNAKAHRSTARRTDPGLPIFLSKASKSATSGESAKNLLASRNDRLVEEKTILKAPPADVPPTNKMSRESAFANQPAEVFLLPHPSSQHLPSNSNGSKAAQDANTNRSIDFSSHKNNQPLKSLRFCHPTASVKSQVLRLLETKKVHPDDIVYYSFNSFSGTSEIEGRSEARRLTSPRIPHSIIAGDSIFNSGGTLPKEQAGDRPRASDLVAIGVPKFTADLVANLIEDSRGANSKGLRRTTLNPSGIEALKRASTSQRGSFRTDFQKLIFNGLAKNTITNANKYLLKSPNQRVTSYLCPGQERPLYR